MPNRTNIGWNHLSSQSTTKQYTCPSGHLYISSTGYCPQCGVQGIPELSKSSGGETFTKAFSAPVPLRQVGSDTVSFKDD